MQGHWAWVNGFEHRHMDFRTWLDNIQEVGGPLYRVYDSDGHTGLTRLYTNHKIALSNRLTTVAGINVMWFNLNNQVLVEPRISFQYKTSPTSTLSIAYALNSRKETTDTYFVSSPQEGIPPSGGQEGMRANKDLGLTRSHHLSASFAQRLGENAMLPVTGVYQQPNHLSNQFCLPRGCVQS